MPRLWLLMMVLALACCGDGGETSSPVSDLDVADVAPDVADVSPPQPPPNILLVLADDMGLDASPCYGVHAAPPSMPTLQALCDNGLRFERAWSMPICSPTRATLMTGRYPQRTGVGGPVGPGVDGLRGEEVTLAQVLAAQGYATGIFGKWHLGDTVGAGLDVPAAFGWDHFAGILSGTLPAYDDWTSVVNGQSAPETTYATTWVVDAASAWLDGRSQPWLLWLAFNAPHSPFHVPPADLHTKTTLGDAGPCPMGKTRQCHLAALEALDQELGRLLDALTPAVRARTWVVFLGDNGTPAQAARAPVIDTHAKDTLYEGGVRVPLIIAGPDILAPGVVEHPVDISDLFTTLVELAGASPTSGLLTGVPLDGVSLLPLLKGDPNDGPAPAHRPHVLTQLLSTQATPDRLGSAARGPRFKLIRFATGDEAFYDLDADPWETDELLTNAPLAADAQTAYDTLAAALSEIAGRP